MYILYTNKQGHRLIIKIIQVIYQIVVMNKIPKITWDNNNMGFT